MWLDYLVFLAVAAVCWDWTCNDGRTLRRVYALRKQARTAGMVLGALVLYRSLRTQQPSHTGRMLIHLNGMLGGNTAPYSRALMDSVAPVMDFTGARSAAASAAFVPGSGSGPVKPTRRSVSETKKKFVAARQGWICDQCKRQLTHTFEVDHVIRLELGGSNDAENLVALCRECHGQKTAMENM